MASTFPHPTHTTHHAMSTSSPALEAELTGSKQPATPLASLQSSEDEDKSNGVAASSLLTPEQTPSRTGSDCAPTSRKRPGQDLLHDDPKKAMTGPRGRGGHKFVDLATIAKTEIPSKPTRVSDTVAKNIKSSTTTLKDVYRQLIQGPAEYDRDITMRDFEKAFASFSGRPWDWVKVRNDIRWLHKGITTPIMTHQLLGAGMMRAREKGDQEPRGGFLADKQGLGKTLMVLLNTINGRRDCEKRKGATLIVVKPGVKSEWLDQIEEHCDEKALGRVFNFCGFANHKKFNGMTAKKLQSKFSASTIVMTTYECVRVSHNTKPYPLHEFEWHRVVLDECTVIKSYTSQISTACRELTAEHRWLISGTPIEDKVPDEFWSYMNFLQVPDIGDSFSEFKHEYFEQEARMQDGRKVKNHMPVEDLAKLMSQMMIRRTEATRICGKSILSIPDMDYREVSVQCRPMEQMIQTGLAKIVKREIDIIIQQTANGKLNKQAAKAQILIYVGKRKMCANSWLLILADIYGILKTKANLKALIEESSDGPVKPALVKAMTTSLIEANKKGRVVQNKVIKEWIKSGHPILYSAKDLAVKRQLQAWMADDPKRKIIVFYVYVAQLNIIEEICAAESWAFRTFEGGGQADKRDAALNEWRSDPSINILLVSIIAGGQGITLIEASRAIIVDLWWNTSKEEQATARIRRHGQPREQEVVRITVRNTYDDPLMEMQKRKSDSIQRVINAKEALKKGSLEDVIAMAGVADIELDEDMDDNDEDEEDGDLDDEEGVSGGADDDSDSESEDGVVDDDEDPDMASDTEDEEDGAGDIATQLLKAARIGPTGFSEEKRQQLITAFLGMAEAEDEGDA